MTDALERLLDSLLWEGYALYPYTPGATKNATPTPFGIVYPPVYAASLDTTFDNLELRCVALAPADAVLAGEVRFLASSGQRHEAKPHRVKLPGVMLGALACEPAVRELTVACDAGPGVSLRARLSAVELEHEEYEVSLSVANRTLVSSGLDRAGALRRSLLSTHPVLRVTGGRFISVLERPCGAVNTFPVLAGEEDDTIVGAAIMLPDHPQIAPESRGSLFDSTEIEEALLLHVQVLSDNERDEIAGHDPAVREMIERAAAATPEDIRALHGRVTLRDPETNEPPAPPEWLTDPREGDDITEVEGRQFRRGATVVLRPGPGADFHARMLDGRRATLERIFTDYDGRTHLGVTIDDDPGQELMRDTGRYLFFFAEEVEVIEP